MNGIIAVGTGIVVSAEIAVNISVGAVGHENSIAFGLPMFGR